MTEPTHNASLPSVQADKQARKNAARELLVNYGVWLAGTLSDPELADPSLVDEYLEEVDRG